MTAPLRRLVLVAEPRPTAARPPVRRYRIARLRPAESPAGADRFAYLKRTYD